MRYTLTDTDIVFKSGNNWSIFNGNFQDVGGKSKSDQVDTNCIYELESDQCVNRSRKAKRKFLQAGIDVVIIPIPKTDSLKEFIETIQAYIRPD